MSFPPPEICTHRELQQWLLDWFGKVKGSELKIGMIALSQLWFARNEARDGECVEDPAIIARRIVFLAKDWTGLRANPAPVVRGQRMQWSPPPEGWLKVNADCAMLLSGAFGGGGMVLQDHHGEFVAGGCHFSPTISDVERVELLACKYVVKLAVQVGARKITMETDCLGVVAKFEGRELD
jgi:hypothetical protein